MATLAALVQALPQELYDEVYRLTFTVISAEDIEINEDYEGPPSILQVNKASRALTVASYYSTNSFFAMRRLYLDSWLLSLDVQSLSVLREVRWLRFPSFTGFEGYCGMGMRMPLRIGYSGAVHWFRIWQWTPEDKPWEWYDPVALRETTDLFLGAEGWEFVKKRYLSDPTDLRRATRHLQDYLQLRNTK